LVSFPLGSGDKALLSCSRLILVIGWLAVLLDRANDSALLLEANVAINMADEWLTKTPPR
jgi:hypothetical protein